MEDRLRIAVLSLHSCPYGKPGGRYTGGMNIYIQNLARELTSSGHMVDIFTCAHHEEADCGLAQINDNLRLIHLDSGDYARLADNGLDGHLSDLTESIISTCMANNTHYDLIHSHYWLSGMVGNNLKRHWDIPHVTMFHTLAAVKNSAGLGVIEPEYRINSERSIIEEVDFIIASTAREKQELISRYNACSGKIRVIPCGINPQLFHPIDKELARQMCGLPSRSTILFVGRLDPIKGLDNLLQAVSLMSHDSDFQLVIVGGEDRRGLRPAAADGRVIFVGPVEHANMYLYYNAADFCVIPSYYESFSLVALESLACGTPIIATDVGEVRDIAQICPSCRLVTGNEPAKLARGMETMLAGAADGKNGFKEVVGLYNWNHVAGNIMHSYRTAIAINSVCGRPALRR